MFHMKNLDPDKIKINKKSYKNILIYYIGCVMLKDLSSATNYSVNLLYMSILMKAMEINI